MSDKLEESKRKAKETYDSAADFFDHEALGFWARYGASTVERLSVKPGMRVLDVGSGTGASAIPAAMKVSSEGRVVAVDLSGNLLELAEKKAKDQNLENIDFIQGDMTNLDYPDESFDAVICVFAIFFVPEMEKQVSELWRMVKPGGVLAITTWGPDFFEPAYGPWKSILRNVRPDLHSEFNPWDRISEPGTLEALMVDGGTSNIRIADELGGQILSKPEDWWTIALGSGLRWTIDQLNEEESVRIKNENVNWVKENNVISVGTNVLYAVATKD
ncbi:MAG: methyltransferase domain-containing protein [Thermodesulfobacteriota bacterium]